MTLELSKYSIRIINRPCLSSAKMSPPETKRRRKPYYLQKRLTAVLGTALVVALSSFFAVSYRPHSLGHDSSRNIQSHTTSTNFNRTNVHDNAPPLHSGPYCDWQLFTADFREMMLSFKIFAYPDVFASNNPFSRVFLPHPEPFNSRLGNYFSEHMFKISLLRSSIITSDPREAHLFFLPFSVNNLRNDPRVRSEASIAEFVSQYVTNVSRRFPFWNASAGADHFYVYCHSVGRDAASKHRALHNNAIQVTCSSSYFQRFYVAHKDIGLPQIWPRPSDSVLNPPHARYCHMLLLVLFKV